MPYDALMQAAESLAPAPASTNYFDPAEGENIISRYANTRDMAGSAAMVADQASRLAASGFDRERQGHQRVEWDRQEKDLAAMDDYKANRYDLLNKITGVDSESDDFPQASANIYKTLPMEVAHDPVIRDIMSAKQHQYDKWNMDKTRATSTSSNNALHSLIYQFGKAGGDPAELDQFKGEDGTLTHSPELAVFVGNRVNQHRDEYQKTKLENDLFKRGVAKDDFVVDPDTGETDFGATYNQAIKNGLDAKSDKAKELRELIQSHQDAMLDKRQEFSQASQARSFEASKERQQTGIDASKERQQKSFDQQDKSRQQAHEWKQKPVSSLSTLGTEIRRASKENIDDPVAFPTQVNALINQFSPRDANGKIGTPVTEAMLELNHPEELRAAKAYDANRFNSEMVAARNTATPEEYIAKADNKKGATLSPVQKNMRRALWTLAQESFEPPAETDAPAVQAPTQTPTPVAPTPVAPIPQDKWKVGVSYKGPDGTSRTYLGDGKWRKE